ncbi:efflux RND transporter periplasmic adaptor subunit [Thalassotalea sp. 1_MG-2023]|uniref:efflux RND transporter periplasmic adaptor subunit n=1 Tax=Thalassotalea sp. 1_MG-2023 TaxID=3062680 RepID=UPI0026E16E58|nr:efflux RND transporter periplasmic adaptor subunit [Thalassotalea sp. 1_MG-2023]MDO6426656.1 efflux RND transporter periplasmic adaptor subunit [Thalassotalea sp. 1_MG-2023]
MERLLISLVFAVFTLTAHAESAINVEVTNGEVASVNETLTLSGSIESKQHASLAPLQAGVIANIFVEAGDVVSKGQQLMQLDSQLAELELQQAMADYQSAQAEQSEANRLLQEVEELSSKKVVAQTTIGERRSQLSIAEAQVLRAKASVEQYKETLKRHVLRAPFAGVVSARHIDIGEWVTQQTVVYTLVEQQQLRVKLAIPQEYLFQLTNPKTHNVTIIPDIIGAKPITATLSQIVPVANEQSRAVTAWVDLPQGHNLVSGMSAKVNIAFSGDATNKQLVWLPKSSIKTHPDGGRSVFIVDNGRATNVKVKVTKSEGSKVAVVGINEHQRVVTTGVAILKAGSKVTVKGE